MRKTILITILITLLLTILTTAESTQQYNKIYLNPYYTNSFTSGTQQNYTLNVNPPDGLAKTITAIINFHAYILPSVSYTLTINNKTCTTTQYNVSTTQASAGVADVSFDCTNIINTTGTYNLTLTANKNTGATTAWLDLTYMNQPIGELKVLGTEYIAGDDAKMFLQFLDTDQKPVNNSECFLSVWYPNGTQFYNNTLMSYLDEGIYYKNFLVPNITGVYPASAKCYRPIKFNNMILYNQTWDNFESNSWIGGQNWSVCPFGDPDCQNGWDYDLTKTILVSNATAGTGGCYGLTGYCARIDGSYGFLERGFPETFLEGTKAYNITFKYKFSGFQTNELAEVYAFDGNWHLLDQIGLVGGRSNNVWYNATYYIEDDEYNMETILLGFFAYTMPSNNDYFYVDEVYIHYTGTNITLSNETEYQVLRGSGEIHVSNLYNQLINQLNNISVNVNVSFASVLNAISTASNLTTSQYQNLTQQINDLQNNMTLQYNNLTNQLNQVLNSTGNITNKIDQIYTLELYLNQTTTTTLNNLNALNTTLYTQFNITNTLINEALTNLTQQINNLNTTITTQINQSKNEIIQTILSINTTLTQQINNLNTSITNQLTNIQEQINNATNLTTQQYQNITQQISTLQNTTNAQYNNLSQQLNTITLNINELNTTTQQILTLSTQINTTTQLISLDILNLNQTMNDLFATTNALIYQTYLNLTQQHNLTLQQILELNQTLTNLTNITTTNQNLLYQLWAYITGYLTNLIDQINTTTTNNSFKLDLLLNATNLSIQSINIATTDNSPCLTGENWKINATTTGYYGQPLTNLQANCTINTTLYGLENMTYITTGLWTYETLCPTPTNWNWSITCI